MSFQKILVAVDKGPIAAHALAVALELSTALKAQIAVIHVMEPQVSYGSTAGVPRSELTQMVRNEGAEVLAALRRDRGLPDFVREFLEGGQPAEEIVRVAREWGADVIIMGSHGRDGVSRLLVGSVAESVLRKAPCPVLVVRDGA